MARRTGRQSGKEKDKEGIKKTGKQDKNMKNWGRW